MFYRVKEVKPLEDYKLLVTFIDEKKKYYDVSKLFSIFPAFKALKTISGLFEQVAVDTGGYGIVWNDEIDLSCNELYENGTEALI